MADQRRRIVLPRVCPPGAPVMIETLDPYTFIVTRRRPRRKFKMVAFPIVERLPDDPDWEKFEAAAARHCYQNCPEPE